MEIFSEISGAISENVMIDIKIKELQQEKEKIEKNIQYQVKAFEENSKTIRDFLNKHNQVGVIAKKFSIEDQKEILKGHRRWSSGTTYTAVRKIGSKFFTKGQEYLILRSSLYYEYYAVTDEGRIQYLAGTNAFSKSKK